MKLSPKTVPALTALAALALTAAHPQAAQAQFSITIDNPTQTIYSGQDVVFTGTITNTGTDTSQINSTQVTELFNGNYSHPSFLGGNSNFGTFANVNGRIVQYGPGQSFTGTLFTLSSAGQPLGTYTGGASTFIINGGDTANVNYSVTVQGGPPPTTAPEPSSMAVFAFMGLGTLGLILKARKRKTVA